MSNYTDDYLDRTGRDEEDDIERERMREEIASKQARIEQLEADTKEVQAARIYLRDQNRLLNELHQLKQERDALAAVVVQMRDALGNARGYVSAEQQDKAQAWGDRLQHKQKAIADDLQQVDNALAIQPDLSALRKREAETLRKAADNVKPLDAPVGSTEEALIKGWNYMCHELRSMADAIENSDKREVSA